MPHKDPLKKKEYARLYQINNKEKIKSQRLFTSYGITLDDWNEMFANQKGCCDICGTHQSKQKRKMDVDHNHETGKVRSLLCTGCNTAIGLLQESIVNAEKLIAYLRKHDEEE